VTLYYYVIMSEEQFHIYLDFITKSKEWYALYLGFVTSERSAIDLQWDFGKEFIDCIGVPLNDDIIIDVSLSILPEKNIAMHVVDAEGNMGVRVDPMHGGNGLNLSNMGDNTMTRIPYKLKIYTGSIESIFQTKLLRIHSLLTNHKVTI